MLDILDITKNNLVTQLCSDVKLPKMIKVRQHFDEVHIKTEDIPVVVRKQLEQRKIAQRIKPGMTVAITSGSRGVANVAIITKAIVDFLKEKGAKPFVFPAMGSHGGATSEGQLEVLTSYGVTEEFIGCPIRSSMETVQVGFRNDGKPVFVDKIAAEADGIVLCGRIKAHTAFRGRYESGLLKMAAIGMGKQHGAEVIHESGFDHMARLLPEVARVIFDNTNILFGVGLLENAYEQTYKIVGLTPDEIWEKEPELLIDAKSKMGKILFDNIDVLVVDRIGKDISGDGMDPNITGRFACQNAATGGINIQRIVVLGLTEATCHNGNGIGMADITTQRCAKDINLDITYLNALTSTVLEVVKIPLFTESDKTAIQLAVKTCNEIDKNAPRIVRIRDTMYLDNIYISEALLPEAKKLERITIEGEPEDWKFNEDGNLFEF